MVQEMGYNQFLDHNAAVTINNITNSIKKKKMVELRLAQSGFSSLWQASRQRQINNLDLGINHIVQDSEAFLRHVINHPNSTRHCVDWLLIGTESQEIELNRAEGWSLSTF